MTIRQGFVVLFALLSALWSCVRASNFSNYAEKNDSTKRRTEFRCVKEEVPEEFLEYAVTKKLSRADAVDLFLKVQTILGNTEDRVTKFEPSTNYYGNLRNANLWQSYGGQAFYVEADIGNLGGLNSELTNTLADEVLRYISDTLRESLQKVVLLKKGKLCAIRQGGDEFSFVLAFSEKQLRNELLSAILLALEQAKKAIERYAETTSPNALFQKFNIRDEQNNILQSSIPCLAKIPHAKKKLLPDGELYGGVGIYYAISEFPNMPRQKELENGPLDGAYLSFIREQLLFNVGNQINIQKSQPRAQPPGCKMQRVGD